MGAIHRCGAPGLEFVGEEDEVDDGGAPGHVGEARGSQLLREGCRRIHGGVRASPDRGERGDGEGGNGRGRPRVSRGCIYSIGEATWRPSMAMAPWMRDTRALCLHCTEVEERPLDLGLAALWLCLAQVHNFFLPFLLSFFCFTYSLSFAFLLLPNEFC